MATDETNGAAAGRRVELEQVDRVRSLGADAARRVVRRAMVTTGAWAALAILAAGALARWKPGPWTSWVIFLLCLFVMMRVASRLEQAEPVRARPARRVVLIAVAVSLAGLLALIPIAGGGFSGYALGAVVVFGAWSLSGWWLTR